MVTRCGYSKSGLEGGIVKKQLIPAEVQEQLVRRLIEDLTDEEANDILRRPVSQRVLKNANVI